LIVIEFRTSLSGRAANNHETTVPQTATEETPAARLCFSLLALWKI